MLPPSPLLRGLLLGLGAAAPIGPVNVELARRTLRHGLPAGLALGAGAVTVDMTYALAVSLGLSSPLAHHPSLSTTLSLLGSALLIYLALSSFRAAYTAYHRPPSPDPDQPASPTPDPSALPRTYLTGLLLTAANPMTLAFWFLALPATVTPSAASSPHALPLTCAGVGLGALAWVLTFSSSLSLLRRWRPHTIAPLADAAGGAILLTFALLTLSHLLPKP